MLITATVAACVLPSVASGQPAPPVTVELPRPVAIDDRPTLAPVLRACLFDDGTITGPTISREAFATLCVIPYINGSWLDSAALYRPLADLAGQARRIVVRRRSDTPIPIFYPAVHEELLARELTALTAGDPDVEPRPLPDPLPAATLSEASIHRNPGLLFLPNAYVAAGTGTAEMRGWQSFFIIEGLLASADYIMRHPNARIWLPSTGEFVMLSDDPRREAYFERYAADLFRTAKGMVDNLIFEITFYGGHVLAANRPYAMTRSAPPLFARAALAVLDAAERHGFEYVETLAPYLSTADPAFEAPTGWDEWVRREVLPAAAAYDRYWTAPETTPAAANDNPRVRSVRFGDGIAPVYRYAADAVGPAPEEHRPAAAPVEAVLSNRYAAAALGLAADPLRNAGNRFYNRNRICFGDIPSGNCGDPIYRLTTDYYASDHAQRTAGVRSGRFGLYGELAMDYAALDLNVLLHQMARDIDTLSERVGLAPPTGPEELAARRAFLAGFFARPSGGFGDRFISPVRPGFAPLFTYPHGLEFTMLWANILPDRNAVRSFLQTLARPTTDGPGFLTAPNVARFGVPASLSATNEPWDGPLGWAPIQYYAAEGLIGVGALTTARTVMRQWLAAVDTFFAIAGETLPVYDVLDAGRDPRPALDAETLAAGEAWTNATYMIFVNTLAELR